MKKVFASAVAAALALSMAVPAFAADTGSINLSADKTEVEAGDEIVVTVDFKGVAELLELPNVAGTGGLGAGDFFITYNPDQVKPVEQSNPLNPEETFYFTVDAPANSVFSASALDAGDKMSIQFFDANAKGVKADFTLGHMSFAVQEGVEAGSDIQIGLAFSNDGSGLVTAGASLDPDDEGVLIPNEEVTLNGVTVKVAGEPEPETSDAPAPETSDAPAPDSDSTDSGKDSGTTTGGAGTTTSGSGTVKPGSDNNKTGDAGVLAIGGLMVLAAGATMLTLKKKSK